MKLIKFKELFFIFSIFTLIIIFIPNSILIVRAQSYNDISVVTAHDMINNNTQFPNLVILDVREQIEYDERHLCNSILISVSEINIRINELEPYRDAEIIVYCSSDFRSTQASQNLADNHNFTKIYNMLGGIDAWIAAGYEVCNRQSQFSIPFSLLLFIIIFVIGVVLIIFLFFKKLVYE
jgi:rhodanese-related sulfurtransferase